MRGCQILYTAQCRRTATDANYLLTTAARERLNPFAEQNLLSTPAWTGSARGVPSLKNQRLPGAEGPPEGTLTGHATCAVHRLRRSVSPRVQLATVALGPVRYDRDSICAAKT